jgi:hypothetical protein
MVFVFFVLAFFGRKKLILTKKIKNKNKHYITERERKRER